MKNIKRIITLMCVATIVFSSTLTCEAATEKGPYPKRRGVILVTSDKYRGLIPTGHAAIVWDAESVIEALSQGVVKGKNNWKKTKNTVYGVTVSSTNTGQDRTAALWCKKKIGKPYNYNYLDVKTRKRFYCSQLVWAAYKDKFNIDLNTSTYGKAVHPMELVKTNKTVTLYTYIK